MSNWWTQRHDDGSGWYIQLLKMDCDYLIILLLLSYYNIIIDLIYDQVFNIFQK